MDNPGELASRLEALVADEFNKRKKALKAAHQEYVASISSEDMAVSLQTAVLLQLLCKLLAPASVLDLGSGFSSYALRRLRAEEGRDFRILSLDTDAAWLERSQEYARRQGLADEGFALWNAADDEIFDLVFLDIERPPQRNGFVSATLQRFCRSHTALLLDDLHQPSYRIYVLETLLQASFCHLDCRRYTMDRFGRWASLFFAHI